MDVDHIDRNIFRTVILAHNTQQVLIAIVVLVDIIGITTVVRAGIAHVSHIAIKIKNLMAILIGYAFVLFKNCFLCFSVTIFVECILMLIFLIIIVIMEKDSAANKSNASNTTLAAILDVFRDNIVVCHHVAMDIVGIDENIIDNLVGKPNTPRILFKVVLLMNIIDNLFAIDVIVHGGLYVRIIIKYLTFIFTNYLFVDIVLFKSCILIILCVVLYNWIIIGMD